MPSDDSLMGSGQQPLDFAEKVEAEVNRRLAEREKERRLDRLENQVKGLTEAVAKQAKANGKLSEAVGEVRRGQLSTSAKARVAGYSISGGGVMAGLIELISRLATGG